MKDQQVTEIGYAEEEKKWRDCVVEDFRNHRRRMNELEARSVILMLFVFASFMCNLLVWVGR